MDEGTITKSKLQEKKNSNYHFVATVDKTVLFISIVEFWAHLLTLEHNSG